MTLDALNVIITANISGLKNGLTQSNSLLAGFKNSISGIDRAVSGMTDGLKISANNANKSIQESSNGIISSVRNILKAAGGLVAVTGLKSLSGACIEMASDLQEVQNVVDTVFGSMSADINKWSENAITQFGISELSAKKYTSTMGAMLKSMGLSGETMKTMSVNLAGLAADMASFYNLDSETAFDKIRSGISGETEPLKQLGINMSVANMEAYALSQGINKSYNSMTQAEQAILRYNYLLSVTSDAQGDFARTSDSWANQTRILAENFATLKGIIGNGLIKAFTPVVTLLNTIITKIIAVGEAFNKLFGVNDNTSAASGSVDGVADSASDAAENISEADEAAKKLKSTISGFDELHILNDEDTTSDESSSSSDNSSAIIPIQSAIQGLSDMVDDVDEKMLDSIEKLKEKLNPILELAEKIKDTFVQVFFDEGGGSQIIDKIKEGLSTVVDIIGAIGNAANKAWSSNNNGLNIVRNIANVAESLIGLFVTVGQSIADAFSSGAGQSFFESFYGYINSFFGVIDSMSRALNTAWQSCGTGLVESILNAQAAVMNAGSAIRDSFAEAFNSANGVAFFESILQYYQMIEGVIASIAGAFTRAWEEGNRGNELAQTILAAFSAVANALTTIGTTFSSVMDSSTGQAFFGSLIDLAQTFSGIVASIAGAFTTAWTAGNMGSNIIEGILGIITNVANAISEVGKRFSEAWNGGSAGATMLQSILGFIQSIIDYVKRLSSAWSSVWSNSTTTTIFSGIISIITNVIDTIKGIGNAINEALSNTDADVKVFDTIHEAISGIIQIVTVLSSLLKSAFENVDFTPIAQAVGHIAEAISKVVSAITKIDNGALSTMGSLLSSAFGAALYLCIMTVAGALEGVATAINAVAEVMNYIITIVTSFVDALTDLISALSGVETSSESASSGMTSVGNAASSVSVSSTAASVSTFSVATVPALATGGSVSAGQLFLANEKGPEIVANYGNKTAVMNNDQIVDAVSQGVAQAVSSVLGDGGSTEQKVTIRGNDLVYIMERTNKQRGGTISKNFGFGGR